MRRDRAAMSALRNDCWLINPRSDREHFYRAGACWSDPAVCGTTSRSLADAIAPTPLDPCPLCIRKAD